MFNNIPSPFAEGNGTHFQLHLQNGGGTTNPWDPATKVQKHSSPPIPGLKLTTKVDKSRAMLANVPGVTPRDGR